MLIDLEIITAFIKPNCIVYSKLAFPGCQQVVARGRVYASYALFLKLKPMYCMSVAYLVKYPIENWLLKLFSCKFSYKFCFLIFLAIIYLIEFFLLIYYIQTRAAFIHWALHPIYDMSEDQTYLVLLVHWISRTCCSRLQSSGRPGQLLTHENNMHRHAPVLWQLQHA